MTAEITKKGSPDYGYWRVECDAEGCRDLNGWPWQVFYSCRTVEGHMLAVRDRDAHNRARHNSSDINPGVEKDQ